jgi:signal transduction histidine kinase
MEAIATQRSDAFDDNDLFNVAREQLRSTISEARQAVWDLRRNDEEEINLPHSLAALAEQATQAFGFPVLCETVDPMSGISGSTGHELLMVTREAIANARSHANPEWIRISASLDGADLTLSVIDNGSGFVQPDPTSSADGHYGLIGMRERMNRIGGTLTILTESGSGTEVVMKLRRAAAESETHRRSSKGMLR